MQTTTEITVRGYHVDLLGHVNHARYLELLEEGRWCYFEAHPELTDHLHRQRLVHVVVNVEIAYRRPAAVGDVLRIETEVLRSSARSVVMLQRALERASGEVVVEAEVTCVLLDARTGAVVPLEGELVGIWTDLGR
jgi:thioesterase III